MPTLERGAERKTGLLECKQSIAAWTLANSVGPENLIAFTKDRLKEDLGRLMLNTIGDGRDYAVRVFPFEQVESRWEGNPNWEFVVRALITLRQPRDCQLWDLILDSDLHPVSHPAHDMYVVADGESRLLFRRGGLLAEDVWQRVE